MLSSLDVRYFKQAVSNIRSETPDDITAKCPICGDSKHSNKARLHLYKKGDLTLVNCFNGGCPCSNKTMYTFLRDFYPNLFGSYKKDVFRSKLDVFKPRSVLETPVSWFEELNSSPETPKPSEEAHSQEPKLSLKPIFRPLSDECLKYIERRGLAEFKNKIFTASSANLDGKFYPINGYVIIPLIKDKEIYGFYTRNPREKKFFTYIKPNYTGYKAWNLFSVNLDEPVYIFEGIFDAMSAIKAGLHNSIALLGAKPSKQILSMIKHPVFCLDNDRTGIQTSISYASSGDVVVWPFSSPKDANEMMINGIDLYKTITENMLHGIRAVVALRAKL